MQRYFIIIFLVIFFVVSCGERRTPYDNVVSLNMDSAAAYVSLIISMDTLSSEEKNLLVHKELNGFADNIHKERHPFYLYFKAREFERDNKSDSAVATYKRIAVNDSTSEIAFLKSFNLLGVEMSGNGSVTSNLMSRLVDELRRAEKYNSRFTYQFYDLLAKSFFNSRDHAKAAEYANLWFRHNPNKNHPRIAQRFHDISFLLAMRNGAYNQMQTHSTEARRLAIILNDSVALARSYDYEAQVYAMQQQPKKALETFRKSFVLLNKVYGPTAFAYNNMAKSFEENAMPDSAAFYYRKANEQMQKGSLENWKPDYYSGLLSVYKKQGDIKNAIVASDSVYAITIRNLMRKEKEKIEEIHQSYLTEKKDETIQSLMTTNMLNEKVIRQQRWMLLSTALIFFGILSFIVIIYRQRLLKEKNALLAADNKRLNMEQKMLQAQLNPHFVFNAIANLQSLIDSGERDLSMRYLTSFSKLLRNILEQNRKDFISLEEEVSSLSNYLKLQQMRFPEVFDYAIEIAENIHADTLLIPPMLIQSFLENSIEHGFRNINRKGNISIRFRTENKCLYIDIEDNGSGLEQLNEGKLHKKSLSGTILKERLHALFKHTDNEAHFEITDKKQNGAQGVLVKIVLPEMWD